MDEKKNKQRIGVYVCHCGGNISEVVDVKKVAEEASKIGDVVLSKDYPHMCSELGQQMVINDAKKNNLDKVVIAACSPQFQGPTFMKTLEKAGLSPYVLEMANIREQAAWPHFNEHEKATEKSIELTKMAIEKARRDEPLQKGEIEIGNRVLVIGGGIAGIQASLDLADAGFKVTLVEKEPSIGGKMAQLSRTFPTEDCATCILSPKMAAVGDHPNIDLKTYSEIESINGFLGNFKVKIKRKPRYVYEDKCVACGLCEEKCPVKIEDKFNEGLSQTKAIHIQFDYAVPFKYYIEESPCLRLQYGGNACGLCQKVCPQDAIDFDMKPKYEDITVDTIIVATGFDIFDAREKPEYGFGKLKNVINGLQMERIIVKAAEGVELKQLGKKVAFIQCIGSRDKQIGRPYCSRICCMYAIKQASLVKKMDPSRDVYIFYIDIRAFGKSYEEYYNRAQELGVKFIRGKVAELMENPDNGKVIVKAEDTLNRQMIQGEFDTVSLSVGVGPNAATDKIVNMLKLAKSSDNFIQEAHPKFRPVDTLVPGVFLAGTAQGPKDIPDTVAQASGAAARAIALMNQGKYFFDPMYAFVNSEKCDGCELCISSCPYGAIKMENGKAVINAAVCKGCGVCIGHCPQDAIDMNLYSNEQLIAEVKTALESKKEGEHRIIIFADDMTSYRLIDSVGTAKMAYSSDSRIIRVPSGGRVTADLIVKSFYYGADAVIVADAEEKSSPYSTSKTEMFRNIEIAKKILTDAGIETDRLLGMNFVTVMLVAFVKTVNKYDEMLNQLGTISKEKREKLMINLREKLFGVKHE